MKLHPKSISLPGLFFSLGLLLFYISSANCKTTDKYFGNQNEPLQQDIAKYLQALEKFEINNSSFQELTSSIKNFFKYINFRRQDELASLLFTYAKLRPDLFPLVQERKVAYKKFAHGKTNIVIRRNDSVLFMIFTSRPGVEWMRKKIIMVEEKKADKKKDAAAEGIIDIRDIDFKPEKKPRQGNKNVGKQGKGREEKENKVRKEPGMHFKGIDGVLKHWVLVQLKWPRTDDALSNCTLVAEYRWDNVVGQTYSETLMEQLEINPGPPQPKA
nr:PREDICTED: uncharacterized protein LOC109035329 [Bemisia tabaci]